MTIRCTHTVTIELDAEVDVDYDEDDDGGGPRIRSLRIAGVELWPLMRDRAEFADACVQIDEQLERWWADNGRDALEDARSAA